MDFSAFEISAWSLGAKVFAYLVAVCCVWTAGRLFDRSDRVRSIQAFDRVEEDARAIADYMGWRVLAHALLAGLIFS